MISPTPRNASLPEEILQKIISIALLTEADKKHRLTGPCLPVTLLLVCKTFERLAKPVIYSVLHLRSREQAEKLADTLTESPALCSYLRGIRIDAPSAGMALAAAMDAIAAAQPPLVLDFLDIALIDERTGGNAQQCRVDVETLCAALRRCSDVRLLIVRQGLYLRQQMIATFAVALAACIRGATNLEAVDLRYRPTPLPAPSGVQQGDPLMAALAAAPRLKVLRIVRPTILNAFLLDVAENPALERIELVDSAEIDMQLRIDRNQEKKFRDACIERKAIAQIAELPRTVFSTQISKHARLEALVDAGYLHMNYERLRRGRHGQC